MSLNAICHTGTFSAHTSIKSKVENQVHNETCEEGVCYVEKRRVHHVEIDHELVLGEHVSQPQVWAQSAKHCVRDHHHDNVHGHDFEHISSARDDVLVLLKLLVVETFEKVAEDEADLDKGSVKTQLHQHLQDIRDEKCVAHAATHVPAFILGRVLDGHVLSGSLDAPERQPDYQVDQLDVLQPLSFALLLAVRARNHHPPNHQQFENGPDEDEEEDGLG